MFPKLTLRPATLPALFFFSLLLASPAAAQDKKPEQGQTGVGTGMGIGPGDTGPVPPRGPDGPFRQSEVAKKAVITYKPEPGFTQEAVDNDVSGVVRLRAVLDASGEVSRISIIKPLPDGLTEKAIAAARQIRFRPAEKDGRPVSQYIVLEYNFFIYDDEEKAERKAVILEQPQPEYTDEARARKVEGRVVLEMRFYKDGRAEVSEVIEALPYGLTDKAKEAAVKIRFTPAEYKGRRVNILRRVEYVFKLP